MPFKVVSSTAEAAGKILGVDLSFESSAATALIADGDVLLTVELVPDKGFWDDYDTNPLGYTLTITNGEDEDFTGPLSVEIGDFDVSLVDYVAGSAASTDNTIDNISFDNLTGKLVFDLSDTIPADTGVATVTFQMEKP